MNTEEVHSQIDSLLPGLDYYLLLESEGPWESVIDGCWGMTGRTFDLRQMETLQRRGEWRGRRPAMYIADLAIAETAIAEAANNPMTALELHRQLVHAVVAHETGHLVENGIDCSKVTHRLLSFSEVSAAYSAVVARNGDGVLPPFFVHSATWIRLSLHTAWRSWQAGFTFPIEFLFSGEAYGLPVGATEFEYALGDEPQCLQRESLFEICSFKSRYHFRRLWNRAVRYWIAQQPPDSKAMMMSYQMLESEEPIRE